MNGSSGRPGDHPGERHDPRDGQGQSGAPDADVAASHTRDTAKNTAKNTASDTPDGQPDARAPAMGSRARDHLANERTYLAWVRTAAGVSVLGLAIAKFGGRSSGYPLPAGVVLVAVGAAGLIFGTYRYRRVNRELEEGKYVTGSRGVSLIAASAVLLLAVGAALVLLLI